LLHPGPESCRKWQGHFSGKHLFWYSMACVMHGLAQKRREAQRTGTGSVDIVGAGVALESIASAAHHVAAVDSIAPQRLGNGARRREPSSTPCRSTCSSTPSLINGCHSIRTKVIIIMYTYLAYIFSHLHVFQHCNCISVGPLYSH
jgi:hypothetical protein